MPRAVVDDESGGDDTPATEPVGVDLPTGLTRRRRHVVLTTVVLALGLFGVATHQIVYAPELDDPVEVDAVLVLAGGGARIPRGLALIDDGFADVIVFASAYVEEQGVWAARPCNAGRDRVPAEVICFEPDPPTTRGEVRHAADLAEERGWDRLLVVASYDQVTRARMLLERCWAGDAYFVGVEHDQPRWRRAIYEWGALTKALTVSRGC